MAKTRFVTIGSGALAVKIQLKKSPKGRLYVGKTTFVQKEFAEARAQDLRGRGVIAFVEGRTVYSR